MEKNSLNLFDFSLFWIKCRRLTKLINENNVYTCIFFNSKTKQKLDIIVPIPVDFDLSNFFMGMTPKERCSAIIQIPDFDLLHCELTKFDAHVTFSSSGKINLKLTVDGKEVP